MRRIITILSGATALLAVAFFVSTLSTTATASVMLSGVDRAVPATLADARATALARVSSHPEVARRIDQVQVKLTTWGAYQAEQNFVDKSKDPAAQVWVVAVRGEVRPATAQGRTFNWALFVFDSTGTKYIASSNGPEATWPAYFDALVDLGK